MSVQWCVFAWETRTENKKTARAQDAREFNLFHTHLQPTYLFIVIKFPFHSLLFFFLFEAPRARLNVPTLIVSVLLSVVKIN